ncbi:DUF1990 domain-containing protein [soil metagenome]
MIGNSSGRKVLDALHSSAPNFDIDEEADYTPASGWRVDDLCQPLPSEQPGPPVRGGSWEVARRLMTDYEFADPAIIRAIYHPDEPLESRDMLLEARFYGLRFLLGVRVGRVRDETREVGGHAARIWGWSYQTLQGHLEMGQMSYEVWKWLDSGRVEFRIHAFSRTAYIGNPLVRLGFRLFGMRQRRKFFARACERMLKLTEAELADGDQARDIVRAAGKLEMRPAAEKKGAGERLARRADGGE